MKCTLDIETFSEENLKTAGLYRYAEHPSTDILCVCWKFDDGPVSAWIPSADRDFANELSSLFEFDGEIWFGEKVPTDLRLFIEKGGELHAWNMAFERSVLNGPAGRRYAFPHIKIEQTRCSMARARACSLPGKLEDSANALDTPVKKRTSGLNAMRYLCKPRSDGTRPEISQERKRFLELVPYCGDDVRSEFLVDERLPELSPKELKVYHLDQEINDRGVAVDLASIDNIEAIIESYKEYLKATCIKLTGIAPSRPGPLADWIRAHGYPDLPNLEAETVRQVVELPDVPRDVKAILKLYSTYNMKAVAKYPAIRKAVCKDGRIRGMLGYHAASTGRWASYIVQIHNLFRPVIDDPESAVEAAAARDLDWVRSLYPGVDPMKVFASCVRSVLVAKEGHELIFPDFSGVESRWNSWLWGEEWKLDVYRAFDKGEGPHPYIVTYAQMFGVDAASVTKPQRQIGKVVDLSMGYQGGVGALVKMARSNGIKLDALAPIYDTFDHDIKVEIDIQYAKAIEAGRTYQLPKEVWKACEGLVLLWRRAHPRITTGWRALEDAARDAVARPGEVYSAAGGKLMFRSDEQFLVMRLPSGRKVRYFKPQLKGQRGVVHYYGTDTVSRLWGLTSTYGGKLCENETQAGCRDLLVDAMLRFAASGGSLVMHVHDEPVLEVPEGTLADQDVEAIMCKAPTWAPDFPLAVDLHRGKRYRK